MMQRILPKVLQSQKALLNFNKSVRQRVLSSSTAIPTTNVRNSPVWACDEWNTLEEVIVGVADYAVVSPADTSVLTCYPPDDHIFMKENGGKYWADVLGPTIWNNLLAEVEELATVLKNEGVIVTRPDRVDWGKKFTTPNYSGPGLYAAMPRDSLLVVGDEIIEAPLAWRNRYFEYVAFRNLVLDYWRRGARWTPAPKPVGRECSVVKSKDGVNYTLTEDEPVFDAADFARLGRDIIGMRSQVTNLAGIEWVRQHLAPKGVKVHTLLTDDPNAMHIDVTLLPVKPGLAVVSPKYPLYGPAIDHLNAAGWKLASGPPPKHKKLFRYGMASNWLHLNFVQLDINRILCEAEEPDVVEFFRKLGFTPIPIKFRHANILGGGFHCYTCDIRRTGTMESYC